MRDKREVNDLLDQASDLMMIYRNEDALLICNKVLEIDPKQHYAYTFKAVLLQRLKRYDEGIESIDQALKYSKPIFKRSCAVIKSELLFNSQKYHEALKWADEAIKSGEKPSEVSSLKGLSLHRIHAADMTDDIAKQILRYYDEALNIEPDHLDILNGKGELLNTLKRYDEALKYHDHVLLLDPKNTMSLTNKATALYHTGREVEALECCTQVLDLGSRDAQVLYNLSQILDHLGLVSKALDILNMASEIDPHLSNHKFKETLKSKLETR